MVQVYIHEECFISMDHNLHFNLGDSLMFDSFIQQHIYFICSPTIAVWPLVRFGLAHKSTWSQKAKIRSHLQEFEKGTAIGLYSTGDIRTVPINGEIRNLREGRAALKNIFWSLFEDKGESFMLINQSRWKT